MDLGNTGALAAKCLLISFAAFALTFILIKFAGKKLPRDHGKEFAVAGEASQGKIRGAGILMMCVFAAFGGLAGGFSNVVMTCGLAIIFSMLTGYLDDRSETPWGELKKGIFDTVICLYTAVTIAINEPDVVGLSFGGTFVSIHPVLYVVLAAFFLWLMINAVNCADGIDGLCSGLSINSMAAACVCAVLMDKGAEIIPQCAVMTAVLLAYLFFNSEPSSVLMGDAGSRPLGLFLGILFLRMGNALFAVPLCIVLLADGLLGLLKLTVLRVFKTQSFMKGLRTPIHDHLRKNLGVSNAQLRFRFNLAQILVSALFFCIWCLLS